MRHPRDAIPKDAVGKHMPRNPGKGLDDGPLVFREFLRRKGSKCLIARYNDLMPRWQRGAGLVIVEASNDAFDHAENPRQVNRIGKAPAEV